MQYSDTMERLLRELSAPRRNNYFYGKLMDVHHFEMEQTYVNHKRWLVNQHALGTGVLCGLNVAAHADEVLVEPGMAVDGYGREIIKPVRTSIDPWKMTNACDSGASELSKEKRHLVTLALCYKECLTDHMPVLVSDCGNDEDSAAATLVETFQLAVREGLPDRPDPALNPRCCKAMFPDPEEDSPTHDHVPNPLRVKVADTRIERMRANLCQCADHACRTPAEPCIVLAVIELLPGGRIGKIDQCRYRQRVYSNQVLLDLILCLAARLEQCCKDQGDQTEAPPQVVAVKVLDINGDVLEELVNPSELITFEISRLARSLRVVFSEPVIPGTVVAAGPGDNPDEQSFLVTEDEAGVVPGTLTFENRTTVRWDIAMDAAPIGLYSVRLDGDGDPNIGRPAIASTEGVRLDGEPNGLPSGDGVRGGVFEFRFRVFGDDDDDDQPAVPPKVVAVQVTSSQNVELARFASPHDVPEINVVKQPRSIRIKFSTAIDPKTMVSWTEKSDPRAANFLVTGADGKPIAGELTIEQPDRVRWTAASSALEKDSYALRLFGDPSPPTRRAITDVKGQRLDGEPGKNFPSGNGAEGGEFRVKFNVIKKRG